MPHDEVITRDATVAYKPRSHDPRLMAILLGCVLFTSSCGQPSLRGSSDDAQTKSGDDSEVQTAASLFLAVTQADSAKVPQIRTLDTITYNRRPGNRVETMIVPHPGPPIKDRRVVRINIEALQPSGATGAQKKTFSLDLSPGKTVISELSPVPGDLPGSSVWSGNLPDGKGSVTLVRIGSTVAGNVQVGDSIYRVRYVGNGFHAIEATAQKDLPNELPPKPMRPESRARPDRPTLNPCPAAQVDVLVVYTPRVLAALVDTTAVEAEAVAAVFTTNRALTNSGIDHRVRLMAAKQVPYGDEGDIDADLGRLSRPNDGFLDEALALRHHYGADVVSLWVEDTSKGQDACGLGYLIDDPANGKQSAFFVVRRDCAVSNSSFGHELGHNLGAEHDRSHASGSPAFAYQYGYQDPDSRFRDIMSYDCPISCARVPFYSMQGQTPASKSDSIVAGNPLGIRYEDDRTHSAEVTRGIKLTACEAAKYETRPTT